MVKTRNTDTANDTHQMLQKPSQYYNISLFPYKLVMSQHVFSVISNMRLFLHMVTKEEEK